ncbi:right-handed parallel beta-helix repeat-containing protein [Spirosoma telluris]|uniref:right-handed parallel beta-helix repeat-containing protein n=1 Tax=Spirosoma telluris TaxID=2183553 RepID=UPI002FC2CDF9
MTATLGQKVTLSGALSKDPEGTALVYTWSFKTKPANSQATIQNMSSVTADFTPDLPGTYSITLLVTDDHQQSASATVNVMVNLPGRAPTASAGASLTTTYGNKVVLDGSASADPDGDKLTYKWSFKTRPAGSAATLPITNDSQAKAEFEPDATGQYVLTLTVSDGIWAPVPADVTVTVNESPTVDFCPSNGRIDVNTTWKNLVQDPTKPDYIVCKDIELNAVLTVEPGVVVAFKQNAGLSTGTGGKGVLTAKGTADKPIVFTGEQKVAGFWDGILLLTSNDIRNELNYVEISYGGGSISSGYYGKPANLNIAGDTFLKAYFSSAKINNCSFTNSQGRGIYVSDGGVLSEFSNNKFSNNTLYPIELPASQVQILDDATTFASNNGINVVAIDGSLTSTKETTWEPFKDGTKYRFMDTFYANSGLVILPGAAFEVTSQKALGVGTNGYLIAKGTADKRIVFTGVVKTPGRGEAFSLIEA